MTRLKNKRILLGLITATLVFASCKKDNEVMVGGIDKKTDYDVISCSASNDFCDNSVSIEYPTSGARVYLNAVNRWIDTSLCYHPFSEDGKLAPFKGNNLDYSALANYYTTAKLAEVTDSDEQARLKNMKMKYYCNDSIFVVFKGENITSFILMNETFAGGVHGSVTESSATFNKQSGSMYGYDMISDTVLLKKKILDGLLEYFSLENKNDLNEVLIVDSVDAIPLPVQRPYFTSDGLLLQYGQYEIAPYAAGMPQILIKWENCREVLNEDIISLLSDVIPLNPSEQKEK